MTSKYWPDDGQLYDVFTPDVFYATRPSNRISAFPRYAAALSPLLRPKQPRSQARSGRSSLQAKHDRAGGLGRKGGCVPKFLPIGAAPRAARRLEDSPRPELSGQPWPGAVLERWGCCPQLTSSNLCGVPTMSLVPEPGCVSHSSKPSTSGFT